jgi:hypothetical protein
VVELGPRGGSFPCGCLTGAGRVTTLCGVFRIFLSVLLVAGCAARAQEPVQKAVVFYTMDASAMLSGIQPNTPVVRRMVDGLVMAATERNSVGDAWRSLVSPADVVGIKVAAAGGKISGTSPAVVDAVVDGLLAAGVPPQHILVWDRNREDLIDAGFVANSRKYRLRWIDPENGYDRSAMITAPVLGKLIWGDSKFGERNGKKLIDRIASGDQLSSTSHYATILTREVTKVINIPSLSDSFLTGLNGAIVNMTLPNIDNWRRFTRGAMEGDSYLAEIYAEPTVHGKVVFTILDALRLQFAGGPRANPNFVRTNLELYAGFDPVAIDATALRLIEEFRAVNQLPKLAPLASHIESAASMGLGVSDESAIETIRVGDHDFR